MSFLFRNPSPQTIQLLCQKELLSSLLGGAILSAFEIWHTSLTTHHPTAPAARPREIFIQVFCKSDLSVLFSDLDDKSDFFSYPKINSLYPLPCLIQKNSSC